MPRPGFRGGRQRGSFRGGSARGSPSHLYGRSPTIEPSHAVFSLADEARSTAHGHSPWSVGTRLRSRPVNFVSAGEVDPLKQLEDQLQRLGEQLQVKAHETLSELSRQGAGAAEPDGVTEPAHDEGSETAAKAFQGPSFNALPVGPWDGLGSASDHIEEDHSPQETTQLLPESAPDTQLDNTVTDIDKTAADAVDDTPPSPLPFFIDTTGDPSHHREAASNESHQVESVLDSGTDSSEEVILFKGRNQPRPRPRPRKASPQKPTKAKKKTFDLDEIRAEVHQLVAKASDVTTAQTSSARTLEPLHKTKKKTKKHKKAKEADMPGSSKDSDQDAILADYIANMRENGDDEDLINSKGHARRDIGGSDMDVHMEDGFNSAQEIDSSGPGRDYASHAEVASHTGRQSAAENLPGNHASDTPGPTDNDFLLAHLLATDELGADRSENEDADDFDFMEWGDPITKRVRRQKKGKLPVFDVSDSELEATLQSAYKNDRLKKAERKKDREMLRSQGLLGKNVNPEDMKVKYPQGMSLEQIADELENFLKGSQTSLTFPPMDNHARKVLHELANKFNIKSKSTGPADQRRPTLTRTARTFQYSEDVFDRAISRVGRKYFPRKDVPSRGGGTRGSTRRGGGGQADTGYRDGEVVGGSAPELGQENRGRAMLEKMGWSTGTALGSMTNKGILQPVEQKVKRGKAGLG